MDMKPIEAWDIIEAQLMQLRKIRRAEDPNYKMTEAEDKAEVMCYLALKAMERGMQNG